MNRQTQSIIKKVSDFWDNQPCGSLDLDNRPVTEGYFIEIAKHRYLEEHHLKSFADFNRWPGQKVLEIGTGIGLDGANFARAGADYTGVELSRNSLDLCRQQFSLFGLKGRFYLGNAENLSAFLPIESYDLVYSFGVIHHTPRPEKILAAIKKYCEPKTEIRIMLYAKWSWKVIRIILSKGKGAFWKRAELVRRYSEAHTDCPVINLYTFHEARKLLKDFEIIEMKKTYLSVWGRDKKLIARLPSFIRRRLEQWLGWNILIVAKAK